MRPSQLRFSLRGVVGSKLLLGLLPMLLFLSVFAVRAARDERRNEDRDRDRDDRGSLDIHKIKHVIPIRRVIGPAEIAALAVHLMTNTAITGATYDIDGGQQLVGVPSYFS